jgi:hypothetical protein
MATAAIAITAAVGRTHKAPLQIEQLLIVFQKEGVPMKQKGSTMILSLLVMLGACTSSEQNSGASASMSQNDSAQYIARNLATFDTLDYVVFSGQLWDRLRESHAADIVVTWPDGHETQGIERHIEDLKALFVYAPDIKILEHPIRIGNGSWTAVTGFMTGTFSRPMPIADGKTIPPTNKAFRLPMATIGHWMDAGVMDHEWLFWDNQTFMAQIGLVK